MGHALTDLRSLTRSNLGVLETIACGPAVIPALRDVLFAREASGLSQVRCAAVEALAALGAEAVLIEFLTAPDVIVDPVERAGTEAVMDHAARALSKCDDPSLPPLMLRLAETRSLPGAIEWLGARRQVDAIGCLITALGDDFARPSAETALRRFGSDAAPALWRAATSHGPGRETETSRRRRRAALSLLRGLGHAAGQAPSLLARLAADPDPMIAAVAACMQLDDADTDHDAAALRLTQLLSDCADILVCATIEEGLLTRPGPARKALMEAVPFRLPSMTDTPSPGRRVLHRIAERLDAPLPLAARDARPV